MFTVLIILTVLVAILLIGVVLIQKSKGGGLSSSFGSANQIMGVRNTTNFVEKATWTLACTIAVLAILCSYLMPDAVSRPKVQQPKQEVIGGQNYDSTTSAPAGQE